MAFMATRTIVTSHPDVACDVCGRRLLRGEQPDVFLSGGQRRTVCELCTQRATQEGWRRETEERAAATRSRDPQRGRSLLDRLRQTRWPISDRRARPLDRSSAGAEALGDGDALGETSGEDGWADRRSPTIGRDWGGADEEGAGTGEEPSGADRASAVPAAGPSAIDATPAGAGAPGATRPAGVQRALEVFNAGEQPRRIAGVARSLGAPCVKAAPVEAPGETVAIVVAWELCWYRYEIDLRDCTAGTRLAAEGMELAELPQEDRVANAAADERGELSLLDL